MFYSSNNFWELKAFVISKKFRQNPGFDIVEVNFRGARTCCETRPHASHQWFSNPHDSDVITEFNCEGVW